MRSRLFTRFSRLLEKDRSRSSYSGCYVFAAPRGRHSNVTNVQIVYSGPHIMRPDNRPSCVAPGCEGVDGREPRDTDHPGTARPHCSALLQPGRVAVSRHMLTWPRRPLDAGNWLTHARTAPHGSRNNFQQLPLYQQHSHIYLGLTRTYIFTHCLRTSMPRRQLQRSTFHSSHHYSPSR